LRAERLAAGGEISVLADTELGAVCDTIVAMRPDVCVIDSVQTMHSPDLASGAGSVAQVREAADRLLRVAKREGVTIILVGHVTKDGAVAGPRVTCPTRMMVTPSRLATRRSLSAASRT